MMYQPTNNRIVVVVMKAAKLKKMDLIGSSGKIMPIYLSFDLEYSPNFLNISKLTYMMQMLRFKFFFGLNFFKSV